MNRAAVIIPEKLFFKIGEVCEITDTQAHVLRYWESEFPMLAPQKNRAGQRTYRKRDVEMVLRIKELLYEDQYTIAGAKKKLQNDLRGGSKLKVVQPETTPAPASTERQNITLPISTTAPLTNASRILSDGWLTTDAPASLSDEKRAALRRLQETLRELLNILNAGPSPRR
ncbi:MAG: MerR family transcriptional regulator [Pyrinomonadaceae bacterium]